MIPQRRRVKFHSGTVVQMRRRRRVINWLVRPLAPNEAALMSLVVIVLLTVVNGPLRHVAPVPTLLVAGSAGAVLRLYAWFRIAGGRR